MALEVEQTITVTGEDGRPAYKLRAKGASVSIETARIFSVAPRVQLSDLHEALAELGGNVTRAVGHGVDDGFPSAPSIPGGLRNGVNHDR